MDFFHVQISPVLPGANRRRHRADDDRAEPALPEAVYAQDAAVGAENVHPEAAKVPSHAGAHPGHQGLHEVEEEQVPQALGSGAAESGR